MPRKRLSQKEKKQAALDELREEIAGAMYAYKGMQRMNLVEMGEVLHYSAGTMRSRLDDPLSMTIYEWLELKETIGLKKVI